MRSKPLTRRCLSLSLCLLLGLAAHAPAQQEPKPDAAAVKLVIDFGDGLSWHFDKIPHKPGMTILDAMNATAARPARPLKFEHKGSGESAFLISIDGSANEGGGRAKRNWFYRVNGQLGSTSFGLKTLEPGDTVLWHFGKYIPGAE